MPRIRFFCLALSLALLTAGCSARNKAVPEASGQPTVSAAAASCQSPYELTQDCSIWSGAKREIQIEGFAVRIAGSFDGRTVLVMDKNWLLNAFKTGLVFETKDFASEANNTSFDAVKNTLLANGIKVERVVTMASLGSIYGYYLFLDSDGYSLLKRYTKEE